MPRKDAQKEKTTAGGPQNKTAQQNETQERIDSNMTIGNRQVIEEDAQRTTPRVVGRTVYGDTTVEADKK